jgi:hypothetical protein
LVRFAAHALVWGAGAWLLRNDVLEFLLNTPAEKVLNGYKTSARWYRPRWTGWGKIAADRLELRYRRGEATATLHDVVVRFSTRGVDSVFWAEGKLCFYEPEKKKTEFRKNAKLPVRLPARAVSASSGRSAALRRMWETVRAFPAAAHFANTRIVFERSDIEGEFWVEEGGWQKKGPLTRIHARIFNECSRIPALHVQDFVMPPTTLELFARGDDAGFSLDSLSGVRVGECAMRLGFRYAHDSIGFVIDIPEQPVRRWFSSLPEGAFDKLKKIRLTGEMGYRLAGAFNIHRPEKIVLDAVVRSEKLRLDTGSVWWITEVNGEFSWRPFGARAFRRIDPDDPRYVQLDHTPEFLRQCLLLAEDPDFYRHKGFEPTMLRNAVADNLATGRFRRGGSTLTMQLVKNLFLTPQKTVFRKLEEAAIVWCIENHALISKDKILELYLNCAQWGPSSYGIWEASDYWFAKKPAELTPDECVFLSTILPAPARAIHLFDENGALSDEADAIFQTMQWLLEKNGAIDAEVVRLNPKNVCIEGKAWMHLAHIAP